MTYEDIGAEDGTIEVDDVTSPTATIAGKTADTSDPYALESETGASSGDTFDIEKANQGYVAYQAPGDATPSTYNPNNFADLGVAVRQAISDAESATSDTVRICVPHHAPDGTSLSVDATCSFSTTYPYFVGGRGGGGSYITVNINDGSPAFHVGNMTITGAIKGAFADAAGRDAEFIRFSDTSRPTYIGGNLRAFSGTGSQGAIVINQRSWNGIIKDVAFNGISKFAGKTNVSDMVCIGAANDSGNSDDLGEWAISGLSSYADPAYPMDAVVSDNGVNWRNVYMTGNRFEGAGGNALIDFTSGYCLVIGNQLGRTENTAHRVNATGFAAVIGPNLHNASSGGDAVHAHLAQGVITNSVRYSNPGGVCIYARSAGTVEVPNRDTVMPSSAGVDYPSGGGTGVYENDSTQL